MNFKRMPESFLGMESMAWTTQNNHKTHHTCRQKSVNSRTRGRRRRRARLHRRGGRRRVFPIIEHLALFGAKYIELSIQKEYVLVWVFGGRNRHRIVWCSTQLPGDDDALTFWSVRLDIWLCDLKRIFFINDTFWWNMFITRCAYVQTSTFYNFRRG